MASITEKILAEFEHIDNVIKEIDELQLSSKKDKYAVNSYALYLHNFYNGVENIVKQLFHHKNLPITSGQTWHKDLLKTAKSNNIITEELYKMLLEYLNFRHFIVHSYSFYLDFDLFSPLVVKVKKVYQNFKETIFIILKEL